MIRRRISRICRAITGSALGEIEAEHAEAMLQLEREELHAQVARYNGGLAHQAALCARLRTQIERLGDELRRLEARVRARREADDREGAGRAALRLEELRAQRIEQTASLEQAEATYAELVRSRTVAVDAAREKIETLKRSIGECKTQEALAELTEMAADMHGSIGCADDTLERLKTRVEEKRDVAAGRVRVARDAVDRGSTAEDEAERAAMAAQALERFERSEGLAGEGPPGAPPAP